MSQLKRIDNAPIGVIWCLLLALVSACSLAPRQNPVETGDGGFLSGDPCGPPCFWNITPGVTTEAQAIEVLNTRAIYSECKSYDDQSIGGDRGLICPQGIVVGVHTQTNIVDSIGFRPTQKVMVGEVVEKYGEPSTVWIGIRGTPEEKQGVAMVLYYDSILCKITLPEQAGGQYQLTASTQIDSIIFSDQTTYEVTKKYTSPWTGYAAYSVRHP